MSTGTIVAIIVVVIIVVALIAVVSLGARRRRLRARFGPEYDRAVESSDSKLKAESELAEREKRVRHLDIRPLDAAARDSYARQWTAIQEQFVDDPASAVTGAHSLITSVMNDRGYPTEDPAQIMADLSVEHASTLENYRTAQDFSSRAAGGTASTEDLRQAMVHYRTLFRELLGDPVDPVDAAVPGAEQPVSSYASDSPADDTYANGTAPVDEYSADEVPADEVPADEVPADAVPASTEPADEVPASTEPVSTEPVSTEPVSTGRTDTTPVDAVSADDAPAATYPASTEESAAEQADETSAAAAGRMPRRR